MHGGVIWVKHFRRQAKPLVDQFELKNSPITLHGHFFHMVFHPSPILYKMCLDANLFPHHIDESSQIRKIASTSLDNPAY